MISLNVTSSVEAYIVLFVDEAPVPSPPQACKIVLQLPESSEGVKGYTALCRAIVVLMSCGIDYTKQTENLHGRVLVRREKGKRRALINT